MAANKTIQFLLPVANYYSAKLAEHGQTPQGADWNGEESQTLRFEQLTKVIEPGGPYSLNDLGCGYGALYDYLRKRLGTISYTGYDISEAMISAAQSRHGQDKDSRYLVASEPGDVADYGVASGIFNVRLERSDSEWLQYLESTLNILDKTSVRGFAFNCLTSYSDPAKMRDYLYYADPCYLFDLCKRRYSRHVALLHDYGLYEFTIIVRKQKVKPLIIFGAGDIAQLAHYYFSRDSDREIAGFTVDARFLTDDTFCGLPVVPFDDIAQRFPPQQYDLFVALSYSGLNQLRRDRYLAGKAMGYQLANYVSSRATVLPGVGLGENCFILEDNTLQPFVTIGNNVTLWSGNHIGHHSKIHDHCFIASHVVVSGGVTIEESCFIGVNATLRDHITVGKQCVIGAGALILADTDPEGVYVGSATERSRVPSSRLKKI